MISILAIIDTCMEHVFELEKEDTLQVALTHNIDSKNLRRPTTSTIQLIVDMETTIEFLESLSKMKKSYNLDFISLPINTEKMLLFVGQAPIL